MFPKGNTITNDKCLQIKYNTGIIDLSNGENYNGKAKN